MRTRLLFFGLLLLSAACQQVPQQVASQAAVANKYTQVEVRDIHTYKDQRNTQSLLPFLRHAQPALRSEAALAFASVQDTMATQFLAELLTDAEPGVRQIAAFALGQTGGRASQQYLADAIAAENNPAVLGSLYEALGKVTDATTLPILQQTTTNDTVILNGQQWGIYRAASRGFSNPTLIGNTINRLQPGNPYTTRLAAANTLARTPNLDLSKWQADLTPLAQTEKAGIIRSAIVSALGKIKTTETTSLLSKIAATDTDYRVRLSAVRAMAKQPFAQVNDALFAALADANPNVALTAAEVLLVNGKAAEPKKLATAAQNAANWRVRAILLQAALRYAPDKDRPGIRKTIENRYQASNNVYEKGHLLKAMAEDMELFPQVSDAAINPPTVVLGTYATEALTEMRAKTNFPEALRPLVAEVYQKIVEKGDVAAIGTIATAIRNPEANLKNDFSDFDFLMAARDSLKLPRDTETYIELQKTLDFVNNQPTTSIPAPVFTHPINWELVQTIPANQQARITTSKGEIVLQLHVNNAPGSVANFVELTRKGFYDGKTIHRVVPNFVVQDGCPRGDGWGSTEYNIRSEFAPVLFKEGSVGLASAGKDTESCQWFITHTATPHLDGRYTNFGTVIKGMDVVHQLQIGDKIESVNLQ